MKLNCAIVDDEPLAVSLLKSYAEKTPFLNVVATCSSAIEAQKMLEQPDAPRVDLLFLDIQMPELDGLEFSKSLHPATKVIFTTAFNQYAADGFRTNALDYLLKPISYADFLAAANKAVEWFKLQMDGNSTPADSADLDIIYVKSDYKLVQIRLSDILYIEGLKDYLKIHLESQPKAILSLISMKKMEERLPAPRFLRVHRSFIVQVNKIKVLERGRIVFGKTTIPISEGYKEKIQEILDTKTL